MVIKCLGTGSSGNCYYVRFINGFEIFLDAGIRPAVIKKYGVNISGVPVFISHEHADHAKYAKVLFNKYGCQPVCSPGTASALGLDRFFSSCDYYDNVYFEFIHVSHNAAEPTGIYIKSGQESLVYLTDLGQPVQLGYAQPVTALIVEANHTPLALLHSYLESKSQEIINDRVSGPEGHLSSQQAFEVVENHYKSAEVLILTHTSRKNFDYAEFFSDRQLPYDFRSKAFIAEAGAVWETIPF